MLAFRLRDVFSLRLPAKTTMPARPIVVTRQSAASSRQSLAMTTALAPRMRATPHRDASSPRFHAMTAVHVRKMIATPSADARIIRLTVTMPPPAPSTTVIRQPDVLTQR